MKTAKLAINEPLPELKVLTSNGAAKRNGGSVSEAAEKIQADPGKTIGKLNSKVNILLVDDRKDKLLALSAILAPLGQNLMEARSGKEALRALLKNDFAV